MKKKDEGLSMAALNAAVQGDIKNFMVAATPGGIEAQEARGQTTLVCSDILPVACREDSRAILEGWGVVFGEAHDDIFVKVRLPDGWLKEATDHSMWSDLVDDKGRKRARIFYKAAFYDRSASLAVSSFHSLDYPERGEADDAYKATTADGEVLHHGTRDECLLWLEENRPNWRDASQYWDDAPAGGIGQEVRK